MFYTNWKHRFAANCHGWFFHFSELDGGVGNSACIWNLFYNLVEHILVINFFVYLCFVMFCSRCGFGTSIIVSPDTTHHVSSPRSSVLSALLLKEHTPFAWPPPHRDRTEWMDGTGNRSEKVQSSICYKRVIKCSVL